jgi:hypothetical protein
MARKRAEVVETTEVAPKKPRVAAKKTVIVAVEREFDEEACRQRAYEISQSEDAGTPEENWLRAERELRGEAPADEK